MLNDILHKALSSAIVRSRLEPTGLGRADGKRPDGITMIPGSYGRLMVWDATCVDTFATSHLSIAASEVCAAANQAEMSKIKKYTVTSPPMRIIPSLLLPSKLLESVALTPCLSRWTWITTLQTPQVTKLSGH
eukprot:Em0004g733a